MMDNSKVVRGVIRVVTKLWPAVKVLAAISLFLAFVYYKDRGADDAASVSIIFALVFVYLLLGPLK